MVFLKNTVAIPAECTTPPRCQVSCPADRHRYKFHRLTTIMLLLVKPIVPRLVPFDEDDKEVNVWF